MNLKVLEKMGEARMDIRASHQIAEVKSVKNGGLLSFGIDRNCLADITRDRLLRGGKYVCVAYIVNREQYESLLNEQNSQ